MNTKRRAKSCVRADFYCARAARLPALTVTTLRNVALREENRENKGAAHLNNAARSSAAQSKSFYETWTTSTALVGVPSELSRR
ncbi:hypothetical protein RRG08_058868 [Elysia crispata]|uniref:Uncharacterized protein n=1 Tax=Elysia crispata TaxID=231223 RepID=A0AAE0XZH0_9GAST|nr:hypothetical protein RRG08_058868 [Elysia crispata]